MVIYQQNFNNMVVNGELLSELTIRLKESEIIQQHNLIFTFLCIQPVYYTGWSRCWVEAFQLYPHFFTGLCVIHDYFYK